MQTRRQLLRQAVILPLAAGLKVKAAESPDLEIIREPNCLSNESADGFASLEAREASRIILLCGVATVDASLAFRLRERAAAGKWVIWESSPFGSEPQTRIMRDVFGIRIGAPVTANMYIRYCWPCAALTRSFSAMIPVTCSRTEAIALCSDTPVAMKRVIGKGGLVFLGSMLGPNLRAEEREACAIGTAMLRALA